MPVKTEKQRKMMCADLGRAKAGKKTRTGLSVSKLREFCRTREVPGMSPHPHKESYEY